MHGDNVERLTERFLDSLERQDIATTREMLAPDVAWAARMSADGSQAGSVTVGESGVAARLEELAALFARVRFAERRISVVEGGRAAFVQADGDFVTTDGRPYRNVYVFRLDWDRGRLWRWDEYANPVTVTRTFPSPDLDSAA